MTEMTDLQNLQDLENVFLYELQHIPIHNEGKEDSEEKYFWKSELIHYLEEGKKLYTNNQAVLLYTTIHLLEKVLKDINDNNPRALLFCKVRSPEIVKKEFVEYIGDYKTILHELRYFIRSNYKDLVRISTWNGLLKSNGSGEICFLGNYPYSGKYKFPLSKLYVIQ